MDAEIATRLRDLFSQLKVTERDEEQSAASPERALRIGLGPGSFYLDDAAHADLNSLVEKVAASALVHGGRHPTELESMITIACRKALDEGPDAAVAWLNEALAMPLRRWLVGDSVRASFDRPQLEVGRCTLHTNAALLDLPEGMAMVVNQQFIGPIITTYVDAYDTRSAYWRARDAFEESRAILLLLSFPVAYGSGGKFFALGDDGRSTIYGGAPVNTPNIYAARVDSAGAIWPGWRELSDAARKPRDKRTEWEGRTLGAARWYLHALTTTFPSASLVAGMSALEALLLAPSDRRFNKKATLAARLREHGSRVRGVPDEQLESWFEHLYKRGRNAAAHEADFFEDERDVERLLELVNRVCHWGAWHLTDMHRVPNSVCATVEEALRLPHDDPR